MKFEVTIEETLCMTVEVEADNAEDAMEEVRGKYKAGELVLDYTNHVSTQIAAHNIDTNEYTEFTDI